MSEAESTRSRFEYSNAHYPIRADLPAAHRRAWVRLASPGTWWTGAERLAIAAEVRRAATCALCRDRRAALSPFGVDGEHDTTELAGRLSAAALDTAHRVATDASRLSRGWYEKLTSGELSEGHYVELIGVAVTTISIDSFHRGVGAPLEPLPEPRPGEPTHYRPAGARPGLAWVPTISGRAAKGPEADLYDGMPAGNVLAALSLVPDEVRQLFDLSAVHYLHPGEMMDFGSTSRALSRAQIELVAGRVSALNECFY